MERYEVTQQSQELLKSWRSEIVEMLNADYVLKSDRCTMIQEEFNGETYSRIHRRSNNQLILEERSKDSFSPRAYLITQDDNAIEQEYQNWLKTSN